jgi:molybdate transport system substrate-binding protein
VKNLGLAAGLAGALASAGLFPASGGIPGTGAEILVYAAASLRDVLREIAPVCERETGARIVFNFGSSNDLARQIEIANKADVFFSADEAWMDRLAEAGLVDRESRRSLLSNRLVVIAPSGTDHRARSAADLASPAIRRLSLANPDGVPAGRYARAWLERAGVWKVLRYRVVPALDVRSALAVVEAGAADAGVVYRTDAASSRKVRVLFEVPPSDGPAISYPVAAMLDRPRRPTARRVVGCFAGAEAAAVFERHGFLVRQEPP